MLVGMVAALLGLFLFGAGFAIVFFPEKLVQLPLLGEEDKTNHYIPIKGRILIGSLFCSVGGIFLVIVWNYLQNSRTPYIG